jgi:bis(5'-nucleosidyl)-tetraphosphatase
MPFEKSAGAVVFYKEKQSEAEYLLLRHRQDYWNFPKGLIEKGESESAAAEREIKEETGLKKIKIIPGFKTYDKYFFRAPKDYRKLDHCGKAFFKIVIFFLAQAPNKEIRTSFEHEGFEWLAFKPALEKLKKYKNSQEILKKADEFLRSKNVL